MGDLRLYLFDDGRARRWAPFTLTRPVGELLFGSLTLRERAGRVLGAECLGHVSRRALVGFDEPGAAPGIRLEDVAENGTRIFLSSRSVPRFQELRPLEGPARIVVGGEPAGWVIPPGAALPSELWIRDPTSSPAEGPDLRLEGRILERPWDLVTHGTQRLRDDASLWPPQGAAPGIRRIGDGIVSLGPGAEIEPGVVVDTRGGPIVLDEGVRVEGPARLTGPLYLGPHTTVLGGTVGSSAIGPRCKIRGEVVHSVISGYSNKAHDGYLGHAVLGRWVNLGAMTTNSDLKNNYGSVRVWTPEGDVDTGLPKVGCLLGDHVKTGIGTMINTGTVIGAGSNVFGGVMPPVAVPPFSWGSGSELGEHRLDKFLETAERVMARREVELTPGVRRILEEAWEATAGRRGP